MQIEEYPYWTWRLLEVGVDMNLEQHLRKFYQDDQEVSDILENEWEFMWMTDELKEELCA